MDEKTPAGSVNLLDDTLLESPTSLPRDKMSASLPHSELKADALECDYQGYVRRKTITKEGRKLSLSSWQRYWLQISGNVLTFFASKSFKGCSRNDFRSERCKVLALEGWSAVWQEGVNSDAWQLVNERTGTLYKFKTGAEGTAKQWVAKIKYVTNRTVKPLPPNLMLFE